MNYRYLDSPVGRLLLARDEAGLRLIHFIAPTETGGPPEGGPHVRADWRRDETAFGDVTSQLAEYFAGTRTQFDLPLAPEGTAFERAVWAELAKIPFGETRSYGEIARTLGRPDAARAVGRANGANPIPIVVPCHRVIGADGSLTGFGGGLDVKARLLELEGLALPFG